MGTPPPQRRQSLCMATAEDRRVRLQSYADAKTIDRELNAEGGGRLARLLRRMRIGDSARPADR